MVIELNFAAEPVLPPALVYMKVPVLVGIASFMVSMCNFAVMYNLPTWFQTVMLTSAGEAGESKAYSRGASLLRLFQAHILSPMAWQCP